MATSLPSLPPLTGDTSWIDNPTGMGGLPIPNAPARPSTSSTTPTNSSAGTTGAIGQMAQKALGVVTKVILPWSGIDLEDTIFIVVGLILVAAAVFSFKGTQTVVQNVSKAAGKTAEVAA